MRDDDKIIFDKKFLNLDDLQLQHNISHPTQTKVNFDSCRIQSTMKMNERKDQNLVHVSTNNMKACQCHALLVQIGFSVLDANKETEIRYADTHVEQYSHQPQGDLNNTICLSSLQQLKHG